MRTFYRASRGRSSSGRNRRRLDSQAGQQRLHSKVESLDTVEDIPAASSVREEYRPVAAEKGSQCMAN